MRGRLNEAVREAMEYYNKYSKMKLAETGVPMKVRVVALWHDSMGNRNAEPYYTWHDYSDDAFCKSHWSNEPTVMIIE